MSEKHRRVLWAAVLTILILAGCSRDPNRLVESSKKYLAEKKYSEAIIELRNALKLNPQMVEAHYQLALAYLQVGMLGEAKQEINRTIQLQPGNIDAQLMHGSLLLLDSNFQEAKATAELILQQGESIVRAQILLGNANSGIMQLNDSIKELRRSFELEPKLVAAYVDLTPNKNFEPHLQA